MLNIHKIIRSVLNNNPNEFNCKEYEILNRNLVRVALSNENVVKKLDQAINVKRPKNSKMEEVYQIFSIISAIAMVILAFLTYKVYLSQAEISQNQLLSTSKPYFVLEDGQSNGIVIKKKFGFAENFSFSNTIFFDMLYKGKLMRVSIGDGFRPSARTSNEAIMAYDYNHDILDAVLSATYIFRKSISKPDVVPKGLRFPEGLFFISEPKIAFEIDYTNIDYDEKKSFICYSLYMDDLRNPFLIRNQINEGVFSGGVAVFDQKRLSKTDPNSLDYVLTTLIKNAIPVPGSEVKSC